MQIEIYLDIMLNHRSLASTDDIAFRYVYVNGYMARLPARARSSCAQLPVRARTKTPMLIRIVNLYSIMTVRMSIGGLH
jgi:hypothetical protein